MPDVLPPVAALSPLLFKINNSMVHRGPEGLSDGSAWQQLEAGAIPSRGIIGHITEDAQPDCSGCSGRRGMPMGREGSARF
jgi:hypothetical protein